MDEETFHALYRLNKLAKQYANRAAKRYEHGDGAGARLDSIRKSALYDYKSAILQDLYNAGQIDRVERHTIDGRDYFCLYLADHAGSFHTPVDEWSQEIEDLEVTEAKILDEFDAKALSVDEFELSEREALRRLQSAFGYSANEFLGQEWIERWNWDYTGWDYLAGAKAIGDRIEDPTDDEYPEQFHFAVGDTLRTVEKGEIRITDRYGVRIRSSFTGIPVVEARYDIIYLDEDDQKTAEQVAPDDLFRYRVLVDDPTALDTEFDGAIADLLMSHEIAFERGDTLILEPIGDDDVPTRALVHEFAVWDSLIDCLLEFDDGRTEWMAVHDFEHDITHVESGTEQ